MFPRVKELCKSMPALIQSCLERVGLVGDFAVFGTDQFLEVFYRDTCLVSTMIILPTTF